MCIIYMRTIYARELLNESLVKELRNKNADSRVGAVVCSFRRTRAYTIVSQSAARPPP